MCCLLALWSQQAKPILSSLKPTPGSSRALHWRGELPASYAKAKLCQCSFISILSGGGGLQKVPSTTHSFVRSYIFPDMIVSCSLVVLNDLDLYTEIFAFFHANILRAHDSICKLSKAPPVFTFLLFSSSPTVLVTGTTHSKASGSDNLLRRLIAHLAVSK